MEPSHFHQERKTAKRLLLQRRLRGVRQLWWVVLIGAVIGGLIGVYPAPRKGGFYTARATVELGSQGIATDDAELHQSASHAAKTLNGPAAAAFVLRHFKLQQEPVFIAEMPNGAETNSVAAQKLLQGMVFASSRSDGGLVDIDVQTTSPALCVVVANAYAESLPLLLDEEVGRTATASVEILTAEKTRLEERAQKAEKALQLFVSRHGQLGDEERLESSKAGIDEADKEVAAAEKALNQLEADLAKVPQCKGDVTKLLELCSVASAPEVDAARSTQPSDPSQGRLSDAVISAVAQLEVRRSEAEVRLDKARAVRSQAVSRHLQLSGASVEYETLAANAKTAREQYQAFLAKLQEPAKAEAPKTEPSRIVERAKDAVPNQFPKIWRLAGGVLAGMAAGLALVLGIVLSRRGPQDYGYDLGDT